MADDRRLSDLARHLVYPKDIRTTEFGGVERIARVAGVTFDGWQRGLGTLMLGKKSSGLFAAGDGGAVLSICRQSGKTFLVGWIAVAQALMHPRLKILWTAHRTRTSDETFRDLQAICALPAIKRYVEKVRQVNGQQGIEFRNGSRIMFGAREQGFGRGFSGVGMEVFDEAQILTEKAIDDMEPATNAANNPLILFMGTPPRPVDPGEVFQNDRDDALNKAPQGLLYCEFSADRDGDLDDRAQWRKANPSYPHRTSESAMIRMRNLLSDDSFRREALGVWDENKLERAINAEQWEKTAVPGKPDDATPSLGIDMSPDRTALSVACCWKTDKGAHIQLVRYKDPNQAGTAWAARYAADNWHKLASVVIDGQSPAMALLPDMAAGHVKVTVTRAGDLARACGRFTDMLAAGTLTHRPDTDQPALAQAVQNATTRPIGQAGAFAWNRRDQDTDISPLVACTLALHGAYTSKRHPGRKQTMWR